MSEPYSPRRVSATVKVPESAKWAGDNPWVVFEGSDPTTVRDLVAEAFGMTDIEGLTLFDVVCNAEKQAVAAANVINGLGGTVISSGKGGGSAWSRAKGDSSSQPASEPSEPEVNPLIAEIEKQTSRADLQKLWAENKAAFDADSSLMDLYRAKGKSLPA